MKKICTLVLFAGLITTCPLDAQPTVSKQEHQAKLSLLKKDTAYARFQDKLQAIMKNAKGRNSNFTAVQKLFTANQRMLSGLKKRYNLTGTAMALHNNDKYMIEEDRPIIQEATTFNPPTSLTRVVQGPFVMTDIATTQSGPWELEKQGSKITWTLSTDEASLDFGATAVFAYVQVTVPDDPKILNVMVDFEYSYFTTGWDTEGGSIAPILGIWTTGALNSYSYDHMPMTSIPVSNQQKYKNFKTLFSKEFEGPGQYTESRTRSTFGFGGNVVPGQTISFKVAVGYDADVNHTGDFGAYHYGEFELHKITLRYSKGAE